MCCQIDAYIGIDTEDGISVVSLVVITMNGRKFIALLSVG